MPVVLVNDGAMAEDGFDDEVDELVGALVGESEGGEEGGEGEEEGGGGGIPGGGEEEGGGGGGGGGGGRRGPCACPMAGRSSHRSRISSSSLGTCVVAPRVHGVQRSGDAAPDRRQRRLSGRRLRLRDRTQGQHLLEVDQPRSPVQLRMAGGVVWVEGDRVGCAAREGAAVDGGVVVAPLGGDSADFGWYVGASGGEVVVEGGVALSDEGEEGVDGGGVAGHAEAVVHVVGHGGMVVREGGGGEWRRALGCSRQSVAET